MKRLLLLLALLLPSVATAQNTPVMTLFASADRAAATYTRNLVEPPGYAKGAYFEVLKTAGAGTCTLHIAAPGVAGYFDVETTTSNTCIYPADTGTVGGFGNNCSAHIEMPIMSSMDVSLVVASANATCAAIVAYFR